MTAPRVSSPAQTGKPSPYLSAKSSASVPGPCCPVWNSQRSGRASISLTAYGQTASMNLSQEEEGPAQTILEELIRLICPEEP